VIPHWPFLAAYMRAHPQTQELPAPAGRALLHG
jgi:hypothetical protein